MIRRCLLAFSLLILVPLPAFAHDVSIDTSAARAVLDALGNSSLDEANALRIAKLPGNQKMIQKGANFSKASSDARFVEELLSAARGSLPDGEPVFHFTKIKENSQGIARTLTDLEQRQSEHVRWVNERVTSFSPPGAPLKLSGFVIAGGCCTGFAFGGNDFYLNIAHFPDDMDAARASLAHELYHAVQGAAVSALGNQIDFSPERYAALRTRAARDAMMVERFLSNLLGEGTAILVGDPAELKGEGRMSRFDRERLQAQQKRMDRLATQLDLSLISLTADQPIEYEKAYALGFYGPDQPLYYLGYAMAKAISDRKGNQRLGQMITGSGCAFTREYITLTAQDEKLPKLGDPTQRIVDQHCRA